jgi:hypothetical protein
VSAGAPNKLLKPTSAPPFGRHGCGLTRRWAAMRAHSSAQAFDLERFFFVALICLCAACTKPSQPPSSPTSAGAESPSTRAQEVAVQVQADAQHVKDYFFYTCVDEYLRLHNLQRFDSSRGFAAEFLNAPYESIVELSETAKRAAGSISLSEHAQHEGVAFPAVLAVCLEESRRLSFSTPVRPSAR